MTAVGAAVSAANSCDFRLLANLSRTINHTASWHGGPGCAETFQKQILIKIHVSPLALLLLPEYGNTEDEDWQ